GQKVAVATHTRTLQDQLVEKDLPRLHRALKGSFGFSVLKGQTNYLCRRRALELTVAEAHLSHEERAPRAYLRALLRRSPDGDLDRVSYWFKEHYPLLLPLLHGARSESATTLGERCPHYRRCYYHSAVAQAKDADVVVVNQALAFSWPGRYPKLDHVVFDEAHEVEDAATTALALELSSLRFLQLSDRLLGRESRRGVLGDIKRALAGLGLGKAGTELLKELEARVEQLLSDARGLGEAVSHLVDQVGESDRGYSRDCRITAEMQSSAEWKHVHAALVSLSEDLDELEKAFRPKLLELAPDLSIRRPELDKELSGAEEELRELHQTVKEFGEPPKPGRCLFATARSLGAGRNDWALNAQPTDVSSFFSQAFADERKTLILTSATLSTGPKTPWVLDRLGLTRRQERPPTFLREPTPFDLKRQTLVMLVTDAPDPQSQEFVDWASARISGLAQYMGGRVLGLFASTRRLDEVGAKVRAVLEPSGIEVLRQSRGNGRVLAARQEQDFGSVLLGTKSFWQGVDIPGRGLSCVFIDKLPLEPQSRPIVAAREEVFTKDGASFQGFMQYRLPRALIQLRQGVGRLIRSTTDRGVVIIADPGSPAYRKQVLAALDGYRVEVLPWSRARVRIFEALNEMGLGAKPLTPRPAAETLATTG
ncbi:MAG: ATP-dependent DNA helicase, partial [Myxococcaceae bacterium]